MKQIYILIVLTLFSFNAFSQNCNIGNETASDEFTGGNIHANYLTGVKHTLSETGTLTSLNLIGNGTGALVQMALYKDNVTAPGNLIAVSAVGTVVNGLTSLSVSPTLLNPGDYWIMAIYETDGNSSNFNYAATGTVFYSTSHPFGEDLPQSGAQFYKLTGQDFLYFAGITCGTILSAQKNKDWIGSISLFPNPSSEFIKVSGLTATEAYTICNSLGHEISTGSTSANESIDIKHLADGFYFLKFEKGIISFSKN